MCKENFDPKDLENQVAPCSATPSGTEGEGEGEDNGSNNNNNNGGSNGGNTGGSSSCPSHKGPIEPEPGWGGSGLSLDRPENNN